VTRTLRALKLEPHLQQQAQPVLEIEDLSVAYAGRPALAGVSLRVAAGEVYGLLGPNGAGKSTLVRAICGRVRPTAGGARILGAPAGAAAARARLGVAPQRPALYDRLTPAENVTMFARQAGAPRADAARRARTLLARVGADHCADVEARRLSGGLRQRTNIAAALVADPAILVLDEPAASLDPAGVADLNTLIRALAGDGLAILIVTHDMTQAASVCDRVGVLCGGHLCAEGAPQDLVAAHAPPGLYVDLDLAAGCDGAAAAALLSEQGFTPAAPGRWRRRAANFEEAAEALAAIQRAGRTGKLIQSAEIRKPGLVEAVARLTDAASAEEAAPCE